MTGIIIATIYDIIFIAFYLESKALLTNDAKL